MFRLLYLTVIQNLVLAFRLTSTVVKVVLIFGLLNISLKSGNFGTKALLIISLFYVLVHRDLLSSFLLLCGSLDVKWEFLREWEWELHNSWIELLVRKLTSCLAFALWMNANKEKKSFRRIFSEISTIDDLMRNKLAWSRSGSPYK